MITQEDQAGLRRLEITHDVLVPLVVASRKNRRERLAKEIAARTLAEESAKSRRRNILVGAMSLLTLLAVVGGLYGFQQAKVSRASETKAVKLAAIAKRETRNTAEALAVAEKERRKAEELAVTAERLTKAARASESEAKENLTVAQSETEKARQLQENLERVLLEYLPYRFAAALSDNNVERQAEMWADKVDYLNFGINTRSQIAASLARDIKRWPTRQFLVMTKPKVEKIEGGHRLEFPFNYTLLDPNRKPSTGELMISISIDPEMKVFEYKSNVLKAKK